MDLSLIHIAPTWSTNQMLRHGFQICYKNCPERNAESLNKPCWKKIDIVRGIFTMKLIKDHFKQSWLLCQLKAGVTFQALLKKRKKGIDSHWVSLETWIKKVKATEVTCWYFAFLIFVACTVKWKDALLILIWNTDLSEKSFILQMSQLVEMRHRCRQEVVGELKLDFYFETVTYSVDKPEKTKT